MVGAQRRDGGNKADDESLRKKSANKQKQLRNQMDLEQIVQRQWTFWVCDDVEIIAEGGLIS